MMSEEAPLIGLVVEDPKNEGFGPAKYTTYRISCHGPSGDVANARHRFSAFLSLRDGLLEQLPGVVVPPLPEKQVMNRFAPEFIEKRREMLEIFLQRIAEHPLAANSEKVHAFLMWPEALRAPVAARFAAFRLPPAPSFEAGDPLRDAGKMLSDFERQLAALRETFKRLQGRQSEDGLDLLALSQGIKEMAENPMNSLLAHALNPFSDGCQSLAKHTKAQAVGTKITLLAKLKLHRQLALAIIEQFKGRDKVSKEIDALNAKVKDLLNQSTKLAGKPGKEKQVGDLETKAADLQAKVTAERSKHATYTQTLLWELERYNRTKNREITASLQEFAISYTEFTQHQHEQWGGLTAGVTQSISKIQSETAATEAYSDAPPPASPKARAPAAPLAAPVPPAAPPQPTAPVPPSLPPAVAANAQPSAPKPTSPSSPFGAGAATVENPFAAAGSAAAPPGGSLNAALWSQAGAAE